MSVTAIFSLYGGTGRSLTAALLALEQHALGRSVRLIQLGRDGDDPDAFDPGDGFPVPRLRQMLLPAHEARHPRHLALVVSLRGYAPVPAATEVGLGTTVRPLIATWKQAVTEWSRGVDDVVIDLPAVSSWDIWPLLEEVTTIVIPVRASPLEVDGAVRSFLDLDGPLRLLGVPIRPRFAQLVPLDRIGEHAERLLRVMRGYDPAADVVNEEKPLMVRDVPVLSDRVIQRFVDGQYWWEDVF